MTEAARDPALRLPHGCDLPRAWRASQVWRILDTFFDAARLLHTWQAWRADPQRPRLLHYVALATHPPEPGAIRQAATDPLLAPLAQELAAQCFGLLPGFHRITLQQGQLLLTLCLGPTQALLREQRFEADSVFLDTGPPSQAWDHWGAKALARCCRRGTALACPPGSAALAQALRQCGFEMEEHRGTFNPPWEIRHTRPPANAPATPPSDCAVIGAGLAGASVAASLARRGWQVQVLDAAPAPAAGASGLPAGLMVPHVSADDSPRSRLSRAGIRLMLQELRRLLPPGQDWQASGVLERRLDGTPGLPAAWPPPGQQWSRLARPDDFSGAWAQGLGAGVPALWHAQAAWVKPARLIDAWLAQPGVRFCAHAHVASLRRDGDAWQLLDAAGQCLATARHVVLANAGDAVRLLARLRQDTPDRLADLDRLGTVHDVRGMLSWGQQPADASALPPFPVNGLGSLLPGVPTEEGLAWYAGASYEPVEQPGTSEARQHQDNWDRLQTLLPAAARVLQAAFTAGKVAHWHGTRCVSADRLPVVGPLDDDTAPTLWISAAMGSRGLSLALLCAELLAARLGAEPWPVEARLARSVWASRL